MQKSHPILSLFILAIIVWFSLPDFIATIHSIEHKFTYKPVQKWQLVFNDEIQAMAFDSENQSLIIAFYPYFPTTDQEERDEIIAQKRQKLGLPPIEEKPEGYLSILSSDGKSIIRKWSTGYDFPHAIAVVNDKIYVADSEKLKIVEKSSGRVLNTYPADNEDVIFSKIVPLSNGQAYLQDIEGWIYFFDGNSIKVWNLFGSSLNGSFFNDGKSLVYFSEYGFTYRTGYGKFDNVEYQKLDASNPLTIDFFADDILLCKPKKSSELYFVDKLTHTLFSLWDKSSYSVWKDEVAMVTDNKTQFYQAERFDDFNQTSYSLINSFELPSSCK